MWECTVTPNDGTEDGDVATANVTIGALDISADCDETVDLGGGIGIDMVEISGSDPVDPLTIYVE